MSSSYDIETNLSIRNVRYSRIANRRELQKGLAFSLISIIGLSDDAKYTYGDRLWFIESNRLLGHSNEIYLTNLRSYQEFANHIKSSSTNLIIRWLSIHYIT